MTVKLSDWIFTFLAGQGVRHVFMLTGGGAMHLNDSLGTADAIEYICTSHEQAAAMAAESYAKVTGGLGVCLVTADHGNVECMIDEVTGQPHTYHTTNPVSLFVIANHYIALHPSGILADVAPTVLHLLGMDKPVEMTGKSLINVA